MKRHILTIALLTGVLTANANYASNYLKIVDIKSISELQLKALSGLKFIISVDNIDQKSLINIKNTSGEIIHSEIVLKAESYSKVYDLSNLPDGSYTFEFTSGSKKSIKSFEIATETKRTALPK